MDIPPYNTDLMIQVRDHIAEYPEAHVQSVWLASSPGCGTVACIAGWAVQLTGIPLGQADDFGEAYEATDGRSVRAHAIDLLGLTDFEAGRLFSAAQTESEALATLEAMIEAGKNGERLCL